MGLTTEEAFERGTNIRTALRIQPEQTRAAIIALIKGVVDYVDAKRTLESVTDIVLAAEAIIQNYPALKLEELAKVCEDIKLGKAGKLFERLKVAEFFDAIDAAEGARAEYLERKHAQTDITRGLREGQRVEFAGPETLMDVMAKRSPLLRVSEREAMKNAEAGVTSDNDSGDSDDETGRPEAE